MATCPVLNVLNCGVVGVQLLNYSGREQTEWICDKVVAEPIGESISQLEHCLQAAHQAHKADARDELVIAALLHDTGQIIPLESTREVRMNLHESTENVGRVGHEAIGASYLRALGFSEAVCRLINSHVAAKRYLTVTDRGYYESLSSASQKSLAFQGGPFQMRTSKP